MYWFRFVRDLMVMLACACVIALTVKGAIVYQQVQSGMEQLRDQFTGEQLPPFPDPAPGATGCPFGPNDCGG